MTDGRIRGPERRLRIIERVAEQQAIHVSELAVEFGVSEMTVRRDIHRLERDGFLRRTYGGATAHLTRSLDLAFNARSLQNVPQKRQVGRRAAQLVDDAASLFLGIGTTAEQFARFLPASRTMTVITSSLPIASLLGTRPLRVIMLGGEVRRDELSCVGSMSIEMLQHFYFDIAVIGAAGINESDGITELNDSEAAISRAVIGRADRVIVIADGTKFGTRAMAFVSTLDAIAMLVTDRSAPQAVVRAIRDRGVEVVIADDETPDAPAH